MLVLVLLHGLFGVAAAGDIPLSPDTAYLLGVGAGVFRTVTQRSFLKPFERYNPIHFRPESVRLVGALSANGVIWEQTVERTGEAGAQNWPMRAGGQGDCLNCLDWADLIGF